MKYYCLVLVACSLYLMGIQCEDDCTVAILFNISQLCNVSDPAFTRFPSLTNCSLYYDCTIPTGNPYVVCNTTGNFYDPSTQTCSNDSTVCANKDVRAYNATCAANHDEFVSFSGYDSLWVFCNNNGTPVPAECRSPSGLYQCVADPSTSTNCIAT